MVRVKRNIPERLARELPAVEGVIGIGTVTDPYQYAERKFRLTQMCLEVLASRRRRVHIHTKSDLIIRDIDPLGDMDSRVGITITNIDDRISKMTEPGAPLPGARLSALKALTDAGIDCYALIAPTMSTLEGREMELMEAIASTGARVVFHDPLNIRNVDTTRLDRMGINYTIKARIKTPYSIWCKMQNKHIEFEEVYDILAVRIIFEPQNQEDEINECFRIYVCASRIYKPHPERLRDWLNHPKANGYQALHVTLMSRTGQWIEVQIRSTRMDEMAEQGFAAHWKYKEGTKTTADSEDELEKWLHTIKEILDDPQPNALDFLDAIKLNLYASEIFVVTPKGEFKTMPADCTALDFAFSIHTFLGSHCIGAKVNHKLVPLSHKLHSGDQVEILTSKTQRVQKEWINFATTAKAKGKIQAILRREEREQQKQGEELLNEFFEKADIEPNSLNIDKLCDLHHIKFREELFQAIGCKNIVLGDADLNALHDKAPGNRSSSWTHFIPFLKKKSQPEKPQDEGKQPAKKPLVDRKKTVVLSEENLHDFIIADCCRPIPGDDVLGYLADDGNVYIHKRQCPVATKLKTSDGNHILAATWDVHKTLFFPATIKISGIDHVGVLHDITGVLSEQLNINIRKLTITTQDGIFDGEIQLGVHDVEDVKNICNKLKNMQGVEEVTRID